MFRKNEERYHRIKELRESGYTISEISDMTGIARSSVGYYTKKIDKIGIVYKRDHPYNEKKYSAQEVLIAEEVLSQFIKFVQKMWKEERYQEINEMIKAIDSIEKIISKYSRIIQKGDYPLSGSELISTFKEIILPIRRAREHAND